MNFLSYDKLKPGDSVAIVSPSWASPARWPEVYEFGLDRIRKVFDLNPVELPSTTNPDSSLKDRADDLIEAFRDPAYKAVIATLGGDHQVNYVKDLPKEPFMENPKPFFGYSDNTHFVNHLFSCEVPSYYGGCVFTEYAMNGEMDGFTVKYLREALFKNSVVELEESPVFNDIGLSWDDPSLLMQRRRYQENEGWYWDGEGDVSGITWGGSLEGIDDMLRNATSIPSLSKFENIVLFFETSEELPGSELVYRFFRALGERGILERAQGLLMGRPKAWEFGKEKSDEEKVAYKKEQRDAVLQVLRQYNKCIPVVQNVDFGHTAPQIPLPVGREILLSSAKRKIAVQF